VEILVGFLGALIGKLSDRYFQLARHSGFRDDGSLPLRRETRHRKIKRQRATKLPATVPEPKRCATAPS
jgi:hypothetical protein